MNSWLVVHIADWPGASLYSWKGKVETMGTRRGVHWGWDRAPRLAWESRPRHRDHNAATCDRDLSPTGLPPATAGSCIFFPPEDVGRVLVGVALFRLATEW